MTDDDLAPASTAVLSIPAEWKAQPPALVDAALQSEPERVILAVLDDGTRIGPIPASAVHVAPAEPVKPSRDPLALLIGRNLSTAPYRSVADHADALARLVREHINHEGATS